jgi:hypothetical protein
VVTYEQIGAAGQVTPVETLLDEDKGVTGTAGVDTHVLCFDPVLSPLTGQAVDTTFAQYHTFAGPNDFMEASDDGGALVRHGPDRLAGATVGLPEPAAALALALALAAAL